MHDRFESGKFGNCWLLGDSGYPLNSLMESAIHLQFDPPYLSSWRRKAKMLESRNFDELSLPEDSLLPE